LLRTSRNRKPFGSILSPDKRQCEKYYCRKNADFHAAAKITAFDYRKWNDFRCHFALICGGFAAA
jgi:hypothetical protein